MNVHYQQTFSFGIWPPKVKTVDRNLPKVLFLASYSELQDAKHLIDRIPMNAHVIATQGPFSPKDSFGYPEIYWPELAEESESVLEQIEQALVQSFDLIAISAHPGWEHYPDSIRSAIVRQVKNGATLLLSNQKHQMTETMQLLRSESAYGIEATFFRLGDGQVAEYQVDCELNSGFLLPDVELQSEFECAALWFGHILNPALPKGEVQDNGVLFRAEGKKINWFIRHFDHGDLVASGWSDTLAELDCSAFPSGKFLAEFNVDGETVCLEPFSVDRRMDGEIHGIAENSQVRLCLSFPSPKANWRLELVWFDNYNRQLSREKRDFCTELTLNVPPNSLSVRNILIVNLLMNEQVFHRERLLVLNSANAGNTAFPFLMWDLIAKNSWKHQCYLKALHQQTLADGICNCAKGEETAQMAAQANLRTIPYTAWFHKISLDDNLFNRAWLDDTEKKVEATVLAHRKAGALGYTLGDECYIDAFTVKGRFLWNEEVARRFRAYLKEHYHSIENLNREYDAGYTDWHEVTFPTDHSLLKSFENPAPWVDYRTFVSRTFTDTFQHLREVITRLHPGASVGWDGCEEYSSYDGIDWYEFARNMDVTVVYANTKLGMGNGSSNVLFNGLAAKSFAPGARLSGAFINNINYGCGGELTPFWLLCNGYRSIWQWHATYPDKECGALTWDLQPGKIVGEVVKTMQELRSGAAELLSHAKKPASPIAIHYSALNFHASTIESGIGNHINNLGMSKAELWSAKKLLGRTIKANDELESMFGSTQPGGHYAAAFKNFYLLCKDLGHQPDMIARQEIESGALLDRKIKILILPFVTALSDAEAEAIRHFVAAGGLLVADYRTGIRDGHGKIRSGGGALDEIFGIRRKNEKVIRNRDKVIVEYNFFFGGAFEHFFCDDIELLKDSCVLDAYNDGTPMAKKGSSVFGTTGDGAPVFIVNHYQQGKTLLLNFDLYSYDDLRRKCSHFDLLSVFRSAFWKLAHVANFNAPKNISGNDIGMVELTQLCDDGNRYVGVFPDYSTPAFVEQRGLLPFSRQEHIYDLRRRCYCGTGTQEVLYTPGKPQLYAVLPSPVETLQARLTQTGTIEFELCFADRGDHPYAVEITVFDPDGGKIEHYSKVQYQKERRGSFRLDFAENDRRGDWTICLTEIFSNLQQTMMIKRG